MLITRKYIFVVVICFVLIYGITGCKVTKTDMNYDQKCDSCNRRATWKTPRNYWSKKWKEGESVYWVLAKVSYNEIISLYLTRISLYICILTIKAFYSTSKWAKNSGFSLLQTLCFKNFFLLVAQYNVKQEDIFYVKVSIVPPETGDTTLKDARFHGLICWKYFRFSAWTVNALFQLYRHTGSAWPSGSSLWHSQATDGSPSSPHAHPRPECSLRHTNI